MSTHLARMQKEIQKIENVIIQRSMTIRDLNDFLGFYFCYLTAYFPLLEYAAELLPENSLAGIANFGMLIDHVSSIQIDRVLSVQADLQAKEISTAIKRPKSEVLALMNDLTMAQKAYISTSLLASSSLGRDLTLCAANSRFNVLNKIVTWANTFSNVIHLPAFAELFTSPEMFEEAQKDLAVAQKRIQLKTREFDYDLSRDWCGIVEMSEQTVQEIPKFFPGAKLTWLQAMEGFETARYIATREQDAGKKALAYNSKILRLLRNQEIATDEWSYRQLNSGGPCIDIKNIVDMAANGQISLSRVTSQTIFVKSSSHQFFVNIPGRFSFYTNPNMRVRVAKDLAIPISHDVGAIVAFYKDPAGFVINNIKTLSKPWESDLLIQKEADRKRIKQIIAEENSIRAHISIALSGPINQYIVDFVAQATETSLQGTFLYGLLIGFEKIAEMTGIPVSENLWSGSRMVITAALLSRIRGVTTSAKTQIEEEDSEARKKISDDSPPLTTEDKISAMYNRIEKSEIEMRKSFEELQDAGLTEILDISSHIRQILLAGLSPEETISKLKNYCESVSGDSDGNDESTEVAEPENVNDKDEEPKTAKKRKRARKIVDIKNTTKKAKKKIDVPVTDNE